jgi:hypothetical protein
MYAIIITLARAITHVMHFLVNAIYRDMVTQHVIVIIVSMVILVRAIMYRMEVLVIVFTQHMIHVIVIMLVIKMV